MRDEWNGTHVSLSLLVVSVRSSGGGFDRWDFDCGRDRLRSWCCVSVLRTDIEIIGGCLGDLLEHWRGNFPAVMPLLRLVQSHRNAQFRIVSGEKANKRRKVLVHIK